MDERAGRPWHVFATYLAAVAGIFATTSIAVEVLRALYPDVPALTIVSTLPGLLAGSLAASSGLLLTLLLVVRPLDPVRFRLVPGGETSSTLAAAVLGLLALGQALDSLTVLLGLDARGSLQLIRQVLEGTTGPDLFGAVLVLGVVAGATEEIFFRGYMQSRLREHWPPAAAVLATSAARRAVAFTGAGVSTESGIPDFRSPGGVWARFEPREFTYQNFVGSREGRRRYWALGRATYPVIRAAEPNAAHRALAELHRLGRLDCCITPNIDALHQRAGLPPAAAIVLHRHTP